MSQQLLDALNAISAEPTATEAVRTIAASAIKQHQEDEADGHTEAERVAMVERARMQWQIDGETEIDDNAVVSWGGDPGAYVAAWVWVADEEEEEEEVPNA